MVSFDQTELKDKGLKVTVPRLRILELFQKAAASDNRHLTADDVFSMLKDEELQNLLIQKENEAGLTKTETQEAIERLDALIRSIEKTQQTVTSEETPTATF